jgi:hypothetical protein
MKVHLNDERDDKAQQVYEYQNSVVFLCRDELCINYPLESYVLSHVFAISRVNQANDFLLSKWSVLVNFVTKLNPSYFLR